MQQKVLVLQDTFIGIDKNKLIWGQILQKCQEIAESRWRIGNVNIEGAGTALGRAHILSNWKSFRHDVPRGHAGSLGSEAG